MSGEFLDVYLPETLAGMPFSSSPRWSTTITGVASGQEHRNKNWRHPLHRYSSPQAVREHSVIEDLRDHWMVTAGPYLTFPFRDPMDFASARLIYPNTEPTLVRTDQLLGIGDGLRTEFQLVKKYTRGAASYTRKITLPIIDEVIIGLNALPPETTGVSLTGGPYAWTVDRNTGIVTFGHPPSADLIVTAGYLFDVPVRFEADDSFDQIVHSYRVDGAADLTFVEVRPCSIPGGIE